MSIRDLGIKHLYDALWVDRTTKKRAIGLSPFEILYGTEPALPLPLELSALKLQNVIENYEFKDAVEKWMLYLTKLEEERDVALDKIWEHQSRVKRMFDKKAKQRVFQQGDLVLLWDKRREPKGVHGKFDSLWRGPFQIKEVCGKNSFILSYLSGTQLPFPYNGQHLKHYHQ